MEQNLITLFQNLPLAGALGLIGYLLIIKVLAPFTNYYINRRNGTGMNMANKIKHFENNCLTEINRRLKNLEDSDIRTQHDFVDIRKEFTNICERVARIEGKLNKV